jgi:protoporphyrinogen oxidase
MTTGNPDRGTLSSPASYDVVLLGGGIAGLAMGRELLAAGRSVLIAEKGATVGGLARTYRREGYSFDLGGHRFHSNNPQVVKWLEDLMGEELLTVARRSRIHMQGKFVDYPIRLRQALSVFGPGKAMRMGLSYAATLARNHHGESRSFEDWVVQRFGRALYEIYFEPYTQKVWGIPCDQLSADWASQRISLPSLTQTLRHSLLPGRNPPPTIVPTFYYPRRGYGTISDRLESEIAEKGGTVLTSTAVETVRFDRDEAIVGLKEAGGACRSVRCGRVISTIPVETLLKALSGDPDAREMQKEFHLEYRGLILIYLALDRPQVSQDHWTYFPHPEMLIGRSHEPKNWSPAMVPGESVTSLSLEVFSSQGEPAWLAKDDELTGTAGEELERIGWIRKGEILSAWVLRVPFAYPVYYLDYRDQLGKVRALLDRFPRLSLLGRTGSFRYMNADGVIEDVFRLLRELGTGSGTDVKRLTVQEGRWV